MKPFDLEKALAGEPVILRNGSKAFVLADLRDLFPKDTYFPRCLVGVYSHNDCHKAFYGTARWKPNGKYFEHLKESSSDIVGMWCEPKLTTEEIMEKAYVERLILKHELLPTEHKGFKVVGKTVNNEYILQDCDDLKMYFSYIFNKDVEWLIEE